ncbi:MAG: IS630 family transposase [Burkholderiales bacterium]|nr:IS630 family transposase [Burkholderiales bacterium]
MLGPTRGAATLDDARTRACRTPGGGPWRCQPRNHSAHAKKNDLKPWRRLMWCIGTLTLEYRRRMYSLLRLYAKPLRCDEPVICIDEKSLQLLAHSRQPLPMAPGAPARLDYEYVRKGTTNLFVAVEPKAGQRVIAVTDHRGKVDFVSFMQALLTDTYAAARRVHLVLDNLNIHFRKCFEDVLGKRMASALLRRVRFHYTPRHASWLNMAEIEIGILTRQCLSRRIPNQEFLRHEVDAWQADRNALGRTIEWKFTRQDADQKLGRHYVSEFMC